MPGLARVGPALDWLYPVPVIQQHHEAAGTLLLTEGLLTDRTGWGLSSQDVKRDLAGFPQDYDILAGGALPLIMTSFVWKMPQCSLCIHTVPHQQACGQVVGWSDVRLK